MPNACFDNVCAVLQCFTLEITGIIFWQPVDGDMTTTPDLHQPYLTSNIADQSHPGKS